MKVKVFHINNTSDDLNPDNLIHEDISSDHSFESITCQSVDELNKKLHAENQTHIIIVVCRKTSEGLNLSSKIRSLTDNILLFYEANDLENYSLDGLSSVRSLFPIDPLNRLSISHSISKCISAQQQHPDPNTDTREQLSAREEKYRVLIDHLPEAFVVHRRGTIIFINPVAVQLFGGTTADYIGRSIFQFIDPEYHDIVKKRLEENKDDDKVLPVIEEKLIKADKTTVDVEVASIPIRFENEMASLVMLRDITNHKITERELLAAKNKAEENEKRYKTIFESSREGIFIFSSKDQLSFVNPAGCRMLGYNSPELLEMHPEAYIHPQSYDEFLNFLYIIDKGEEYYGEISGINKTSQQVDFDVYGCPMESEGMQLYFCTAFDITEQKKYEAELIKAKNSAEEADRLKSAFLANMSHEVRTPMNGIIGFADMLKHPNLNDDRRLYYIDIINKSSHQLLTIINDIVDISKIESGQIDIYPEEININKLINDLYKLFEPMASSKNIEFVPTMGLSDDACQFYSDSTRIKQVLNNLLSNAFKFTHEGRVQFGYTAHSKDIQFYVEDTGIGIDKKDISYIFEHFRQVEMNATRNYGGNGLGLSISKALVEKMGGEIWLESTPSKGSTFYFSIPFHNTHNTKKAEVKDVVRETNHLEIPNTTILVAEDEDINYLFISEIFAESNFDLIRAINGKEAVELFKENDDISLVLMDIKMPVMDGYEATKKIKSIRQNIPVIAQTAYAMSGDKEKSLDAGCDDYITKPIKKKELLTKVTELLKNNQE